MIIVGTREKIPKITMLFDWFIIYSFLGWVYETIYCSVNLGRYSERGFLYGPICPIYGVCIVAAILLFSDRVKNNIILFFSCAFLSSCVEYMVSSGLEFIFGRRWWNYSNQLFNIEGKVCLGAAIVFGLIGIMIIRYLHPKLVHFMNVFIHAGILKRLTRLIFTIFLFDLFITIIVNL